MHPSENELKDYFEGRLKGEPFRRVDDHIQSCPDCQDTLASLQQLPPD